MATQYQKERDWAKTNPGLSPEMRAWFTALDAIQTWPTTTTTTTTTTTSTTTTTT
jgi:hypothetical protein